MAKRVLYVNPTADISGGENSLLALLQGLDRSQYEPLLICPAQGRLTQRAQIARVPYQVHPTQQLSLTGSPLQVFFDLFRSLPAARRWRDLIVREDVDLVHVNSFRIAVACSLGARLAHRPVLWHVRDIPTSPFKRRLLTMLALNLADRIVAVSEAVAHVFEHVRARPSSVRVIYNGINLSAFVPTVQREVTRAELEVPPDTILVGNIGQLVPWKGYDLLLHSMAQPEVRALSIRLLIVGESISPGFRVPQSWWNYKERLLVLSQQLGLDNSVQFLGFREDISNLMAALDIYAHAAIWPDPLPRSILEAMASGLAIVAPAIGGIPEMVCDRESGWLYPVGQMDALAQAIVGLAPDAQRRRELGQAARLRCQTKFSLEAHLNQVQALYDEVLRAGRA